MKNDKIKNWIVFFAFWMLCGSMFVMVAQEVTNSFPSTNGLPPLKDPTTSPLPQTVLEYWQFLVPMILPFVVALLKWIGPKIPRRVIPAIPPFLGLALGLTLWWLKGQTWVTPVLLTLFGFAATGIRELTDQNIVQPNTPPAEKITELKEKIIEVQDNPRATT